MNMPMEQCLKRGRAVCEGRWQAWGGRGGERKRKGEKKMERDRGREMERKEQAGRSCREEEETGSKTL